MPDRFDGARARLREAIAARVTPAAVVEVGHRRGRVWSEAFGTLTYAPDAPICHPDVLFDLASLTKVIATTTLVMDAVATGRLPLDELVARRLPGWRGEDRAEVTIEDLLAHCSGLTAYLPFFRDHSGRAEFEEAICRLPLEYAPRTQALYSDLGFILLGFLLEDVGARSLDEQFARRAAQLDLAPLLFNPPRTWRDHTAPTEIESWRGRLLVAEVHDENAWALGGVAGHAGLFGTASSVGRFARLVLDAWTTGNALAPRVLLRRFAARSSVPGSSRALGWDTALPTSSCGSRMSAQAIGHTGFTGVSLWLDPALDLYVVLLTNRVHPTRDDGRMQVVRRDVHDAIVGSFLDIPPPRRPAEPEDVAPASPTEDPEPDA